MGGCDVEKVDDLWLDLIDRMMRARASQLYMPASLLILLIALDPEPDGTIMFGDFEPLFTDLVGAMDAQGSSKAWEPFFHLSRSTQLWALRDEKGPSDFADMHDGRPKRRTQLAARADRAIIEPRLLPALRSLSARAALLDALATRLLEDDEPKVRRLVVLATSLEEARPGLLEAARLALGARPHSGSLGRQQ